MELVFQTLAWEDYLYWQEQDKKMLARINELIKDTLCSPFKRIGQPEALHGDLSGSRSRRISDEYRLVYVIHDGGLHILQCRYHYPG